MLFNSLDFCIYLPIVFCIYWVLLGRNLKIQNFFIVLASYIFYGWWDWRFLFLIAFTTICSWFSGILIEKYKDANNNIAKTASIVNIVINIGILLFFKYYNFFVESFVNSFAFMGKEISARSLNIILPVGISFYTFQALSYSIDVYRGKVKATNDIVAFFAFVSFFPQLVAGPIERSTNLLPQFYVKRTFDVDNAIDGCKQMVWGFFKKIVVADTCALVVNSVFGNISGLSGSTLFLGAFFFAFQIYCDFSGYSDIAIGVSKLFGFKLMTNFDKPYFSRNISEFWGRWHISLQKWFIDYIYIPLGGSREGRYKTFRNILIVFSISGLWHGANWTFVVWGIYHACLLILLNVFVQKRKYRQIVAYGNIFPTFKEGAQMISTFVLVVLGWVLFRATSINEAYQYFEGIFDVSLFSIPKFWGVSNIEALFSVLFIAILIVLEWFTREKEYPMKGHGQMQAILCAFVILLIYFFGLDSSGFIYFQF